MPSHSRTPNFNPISGTTVASLNRLKDDKGNDGAFFVFTDLSVKLEGKFKLQFNLYEMQHKVHQWCFLKSVISDTFNVQNSKVFLGMEQSTPLTRAFNDQGVRMRVRKNPKDLLRKKGPAAHDYEPRHYNRVQAGPSSSRESSDMRSARGMSAYSQPEVTRSNMAAPPLPTIDTRPQTRRFSHGSNIDTRDEPPAKRRTRTASDHSEQQSFIQPEQHYQPQALQYDSQTFRGYQNPSQSPYSDYSPMAPPPPPPPPLYPQQQQQQQQQQHHQPMFSGYQFGQLQPGQHSPAHDFHFGMQSPFRQQPPQSQPTVFFSQGPDLPQFAAHLFSEDSAQQGPHIDPIITHITQAESRLTDMSLQSPSYPHHGHHAFPMPPMQQENYSAPPLPMPMPTTTGPLSAREGGHPAHFDQLRHMGPPYQ
jgi:hypothetical protein